mmetsp:Transcript_41639/g.46396  ORF Transcript_41639/g.46396 Transcript_41639/m.46396 type:complete len:1796 (+) Transcript_41639:255-5642(+)
MNFVNQLEDHLRDLGAEARKNHPGVKLASEHAILKLRTLQNQYVSAVRKASHSGEKHPDTRLFRSSDLLHPFLLAANYPNASPKLLDTSFKAMKALLEADAICPGDSINMVRVWMIQAQVVVSYSTTKDGGNNMGGSSGSGGISAATAITTTRSTKGLNTTKSTIVTDVSGNESTSNKNSTSGSSSSSWFGGYFYSSSSTSNAASITNSVTTKTAVSSSHGNAGSGHLNGKDLEKIALGILSCLLQLLELKDLPISNEQWIQSVTLCCLLYLPLRQNVRQAAHSTLPQVLSLLFKNDNASQLKIRTWDDLLSCALGISSNAIICDRESMSTSGQRKRKSTVSSFQGAFSHCRLGEWDAALPPSQSLALELMTTLLKESPNIFTGVGQKTFGVIVQVLQKQSKIQSKALPMEFSAALQFALVVLQTQGVEWPAECRELIGRLVQPISLATEALRKQADFEDGYIYKVPNKSIPVKKSSSSGGSKLYIETLQGLPQTVLWKAALSMETLKTFIEDKQSCKELWLHEDVTSLLLEATSDFCTIGASCENHMNMLIIACQEKNENTSLTYSAETLDNIEQWQIGKFNNDVHILGDTLWVGFNALLLMIDQLEEKVLAQTFAPSLSVLQHYLKRFPASGTIVERSLEGYFSLAKVSLNSKLLRGALLSSLCKLSLPQWGRKDSFCLLKDHNIAALVCLLNVAHRYYDRIGTDWLLIMQTFKELSLLAIASPDLSNGAYVGALSISAAYARFASFSTCFSDKSLSQFVAALKEVSLSEKPPSIIPSVRRAGSNKLDKSNRSQDDRGTIGGKLIKIGVRARAIAWNSDGSVIQEDVPVADRTNNTYYDDYQIDFNSRMASSRYPIRNRNVPFSAALLADVVMSNNFRHSRCGVDMFRQLCIVSSEFPPFRSFFMDFLVMLIISHVAEEEDIPSLFFGPSKIMYTKPRQNQLLAVEKIVLDESMREAVSQIDLLGPLCECITKSKDSNIAEASVEALYSVLENTGHKMRNQCWTLIVDALASVPSSDHKSEDWTIACQVGFRCLKLIIDDFLEDAASSARNALLDCCSTFGSSQQDMNTSLTAIGLLWTIADQDLGTESVDRALAKLVLLAADSRAEVRNCSVNTLFSCIVGCGPKFTENQWESCICTTIFGVYDTVTSDTEKNNCLSSERSSKKKSRYQVNVHFSRDTPGKQWCATQAIVLKGLCRLLRNFFNPLLNTTDDGSGSASRGDNDTPWFDKAWNKILGWAYDASIQGGGKETLELRNSGAELMVLCNQLTCAAGIQAAITPARVGTNMEVINGALRNVGSPEKSDNQSIRRQSNSAVAEMWRENLFLDAFDVLESFRDHLESQSSADKESVLSPYLEPTQNQVLNKIAVELSKLYECCKNNEFEEDLTLSNYSTFEPLLTPSFSSPGEDDTMTVRFVRVIISIATRSSGGPGARFLSQAQRSCIDLLKLMASNGSPEAFLNLTVLSGEAFYAEKESNGKCKKGVEILSHESSNAILAEYKSKTVSNQCKSLVLGRLLSLFLNKHNNVVKRNDENENENHFVGISYEMLIPIMKDGLESAKRLDNGPEETSRSTLELLDNVWKRVCLTLSRMFASTSTAESQGLNILFASNLVSFVDSSAANAPSTFSSDLCTIYFSGASKCLKIIKINDTPSENVEDFLILFAACFSGMCRIKPEDKSMHNIAEQVLLSTIESLESAPTEIGLNIKASLKICEVLQKVANVEIIVIAVLPQLSHLVGVEERSVRRAAGAVLAKANINGVLIDAQNRCKVAEEYARIAENKVSELEKEVAILRNQR